MTPVSPGASQQVSRVLGLDRKGRGTRRLRFWVWGVILLAVLAGAGLLFTPAKENGIRFETAEIQRGDLRVRVTATGKLEPVNQVDVGTEVSGTIESVAVDYNDRGQAGEVLGQAEHEPAGGAPLGIRGSARSVHGAGSGLSIDGDRDGQETASHPGSDQEEAGIFGGVGHRIRLLLSGGSTSRGSAGPGRTSTGPARCRDPRPREG